MTVPLNQQMLERIDVGVVLLDWHGNVVFWNHWMERHSNYHASVVQGQSFLDVFEEVRGSRIELAINKALNQNSPSLLSARLLKVSLPLYSDWPGGQVRGERIAQAIQIHPVHDDQDRCFCMVTVLDISSAVTREQSLRTQSTLLRDLVESLQVKERELSTLFENTQTGILVFEADGCVISANRAARTMFGMPLSEPLEQVHLESLLLEQELDAELERAVLAAPGVDREGDWLSCMADSQQEYELIACRRNGSRFPVSVTFNRLPGSGVADRFFVFLRDVTEARQYEQQLFRMAHYDGLTGLANRLFFQETLQRDIAQPDAAEYGLSVLFIDLDRFKSVNDNHGHEAGDELLRQVADRLMACCHPADMIARWAGDEFVVALTWQGSHRSPITVADNILKAMASSFDVLGRQVQIGASIGVAQYPEDAGDADRLLSCADQAMYQAKQDGKGLYRFYTSLMDERSKQHRLSVEELRCALMEDQLELVFLPRLDIANGVLSGVGVGLQWHHPVRGLMETEAIFQDAEASGLSDELADWIMVQVFENTARWHKRQSSPSYVSVKLSSGRLLKESFVTRIRRLLSSVGFPAHLIVLEISQAWVLADHERSLDVLGALKSLGIRIALAGFGEGYGSLSSLKQLPIDMVHIHVGQLQPAAEGNSDAKVLAAMIALARALDLAVVAEGVTNRSQLEWLGACECEWAQGDGISSPLNPDTLGRWQSDIVNIV